MQCKCVSILQGEPNAAITPKNGRGVANVFERLLADLLPSSVWIDLDREKSVANQPLGPPALKERSSDSSEGDSVRLFIKGAHEFKVSG
jgi:hypothetical protein